MAPEFHFQPAPIGERKVPKKASTFHLISSAVEFVDELEHRVEGARRSVRMQSFLLSNDKRVGRPILLAAANAAGRDVPTKIMADGMAPIIDARLWWITYSTNILGMKGYPIEFRRPVERRTYPWYERVKEAWQRDHVKNIVVDAEDQNRAVAYIGGRNIWKKDPDNRDFMVRITGELAGLARDEFDRTWDRTVKAKEYTDSGGNRLIRDTRDTELICDALVGEMRAAKSRIWLQVPYYDRKHISPVLIAIKRQHPDLDIRVLVPAPKTNNHFYYNAFAKLYMDELAEHDIVVFGYKVGKGLSHMQLNHAKGALIDDMSFFGSSNFNKLLALGGRDGELEVVTKDPDMVAQHEQWMEHDMHHSVQWEKRKRGFGTWLYRRLRPKDRKLERMTAEW